MEARRFKPDENLIFHLIKSQSSTVETALRELVQNAYDAGATSCYLETNAHGFRVSDDGRGFADRQEVEACFETFGTPHLQERQERFGRFRMGRCQIMAFAPTNWHSNHFQMNVDFKHRGLEYDLSDDAPQQLGCEIQGQWYSALSQSELKKLTRDLSQYFEFFYLMPVWLNGRLLSKPLEQLPIAAETDDCYVIYDENRPELSIYNLGIYVGPLYEHFAGNLARWKLTGAVLTKRHLQLDISRQHISHTCPVWQRINSFLAQRFPRSKRKGYLSSAQIQDYLHSIYTGEVTIQEVRQLKLFQDPPRTRRYSLEELAACHSFTFAYSVEHEVMADKISQAGKTLVISLRDIAQVQPGSTYQEQISCFFEALDELEVDNECVREQDLELIEQVLKKYQPFECAADQFMQEFAFVSEAELSPEELCAFKAVRAAQVTMLKLPHNRKFLMFRRIMHRVLRVGYSLTADGWTDGSSFIALNRALLRRLAKGMLQSEYLAAVLVHEWCHQSGDSGAHDGEFYRRYHDITCTGQRPMLATFAFHINRNYALSLRRAGLPVPKAVVRHLTGKLGQAERDCQYLHQTQQAKEQAEKANQKGEAIATVLYAACEFLQAQSVNSLPKNLRPVLQMFEKQDSPFAKAFKAFDNDIDWKDLMLEQFDAIEGKELLLEEIDLTQQPQDD